MTKQELDIMIDDLKGNINRMCVTDDEKDLLRMFDFAHTRLYFIRDYNVKRIELENNRVPVDKSKYC